MMKFEVLEALEQLKDDRAKKLVELGREFYELAGRKDQIHNDLELCKEAIRLGFRIMDIGRLIGQ